MMNRKTVGRVLVFAGISVWIPYFALKLSGAEVELMNFLPFHLALVIPGSVLVRGREVWNKILGRLDRVDDNAENGSME